MREGVVGVGIGYRRELSHALFARPDAVEHARRLLDEALHLQSEFGKNAFQEYVDEMAKFGEIALSVAKDAAIPLQARATAFAEVARQAA